MNLTWYFDFISPFAYLQHRHLQKIAPDLPRANRPVLLGALLKHWEQKGPAEIPTKRTLTYWHCQFLAERLGIPYKMPPAHPFNPLPPLRMALAAKDQAAATELLFDAVWKEGLDVNDPAVQGNLLEKLDLNPEDLRADAVKAALRENTDAALAEGVFGVPTLVVGGRLFWGFDMTDLALAVHARPDLLEHGEYQRLASLPDGLH